MTAYHTSTTIALRVDGHPARARLDGRDYEAAAGRAAARSIGRRPSAVYGVTDDGRTDWGDGSQTRRYVVTVTTGPRNGDVYPVRRVRVAIDGYVY